MDRKKSKSGEKNKRNEVLQCALTHLEKRLIALEEELVDLEFQASLDFWLKQYKASKNGINDYQQIYSNAHQKGFNIFKVYMKRIQPDENWDEVSPTVVNVTLGL